MRSNPNGPSGLGGGWTAPLAFNPGGILQSADAADHNRRALGDDELVENDNEHINQEIHRLARQFTAQSQAAPALFPLPASGPLNPDSPDFNARKWARAFYDIRKDALGGNAPKTAGVAFRHLGVFGFGTATDFQKSVGNVVLEADAMFNKLFGRSHQRIDILRDLEGVVRSGEMVAVLGPPGSGCSTFLKTMAGETHGFYIEEGTTLNYQGIRPEQMRSAFRGEAIYAAEVDQHFPHLTVGDTLSFAAWARTPKDLPGGISRQEFVRHLRDVTMNIFGISHTKNTRVGDDFVRGVSGGERKRVTIAEAALSYAPLQCWDNSTRGLDSANSVEFCKTLRTQADVLGTTSFVAIYQAPQAAYDFFDKVLVLYQGRQIFFGEAAEATAYFENLGFVCPEQQTTADFLTSMTSHAERIIRPGWEGKTPRSPDEFAQAWKESKARERVMSDFDDYMRAHPFDGEDLEKFAQARRMVKSDSQRQKSPYTLSYLRQLHLNIWRSWVMLKTDPSMTLTMLISNIIEALIISSIFYNLSQTTASFRKRGFLIFFVILMNAFSSVLEIMTLYSKRRIIEKHNRYALYHPSAEALASMVVDLPYKLVNAILMNTLLYFMGNLRREPGPFFFFLLISFTTTLTMSTLFRLIGSTTRSISQALAPAAIMLMALVLYTGFTIPVQYMRSWIAWCRFANPIFYSLEAVMLNEFVGRDFPCSSFVPQGPGYEAAPPSARACSVQGVVPGQDYVSGAAYLAEAFGYDNAHRWRNFGILIAFMAGYLALHLLATEYITSERSKGEVLVFSRREMKRRTRLSRPGCGKGDPEKGPAADVQQNAISTKDQVAEVERQTSIFHWKDVCYDIKIKGEARRLLDHVDGWVKPGTLTALMGPSGAGKTTLLDVLASRVTMGVVTGDMLVDGQLRDESFQRKTGYVQQQDLHLATSTVREALTFSALLRQPPNYSRQEKLDYVDTVISLLNMDEYSDAVIGVPGEGLNVEQRKRLTIGVELAARPQLLLFLDEPTSGLDSQTSWSICDLLEKLTNNGQAILCTIHQPSAMLFQRFDRLLLLLKGRTIYFGDVGANSHVLVDYLSKNGGAPCPPGANPAEHMLDVIKGSDIDWPSVWENSPERRNVQAELVRLGSTAASAPASTEQRDVVAPGARHSEFAASWREQVLQVSKRVFQQYWRSPSYIYSKALLAVGATLFIGLSFLNGDNTQRGLLNQMYGVFIFLTVFPQLVNQIMPLFVSQRTMYEARERPSKAYSWKAFMLANIVVEIAWNSLVSVFSFVCWYFPIGLYRNAEWTNQVNSRGITMFLQVWAFYIFTSTFANMAIAAIETAEVAGGVVNLFMIMMFAFCGVLAGPNDLPGFWIFMYRVNPFTYVLEGFLGTSLANAPMSCEANEFISLEAPSGATCGEYMAEYVAQAGGFLQDPGSSDCRYCAMSDTNAFLATINVSFDNRWRDFGFMWAYCIFNITAAVGLYWLVRVPRKDKEEKTKK